MMCVRQLLFAALVQDASASTARNLLPVIERSVKRRLQLLGSGSSTYSPECLEACPAAGEMQEKIEQASMKAMMGNADAMKGMMGGGDQSGAPPDMSAMAGMIEDMTLSSYAVMCDSKPAMTCLSENAAVCEGGDASAKMVMDGFDCMCTACPCMQTAMAGMASMMMGMLASLGNSMGGEGGADSGSGSQDPAAGQAAMQEMMGGLCQMAPALTCMQREATACSGVMGDMDSSEGGSMNLLGMLAGGGDEGGNSSMLDQNGAEMAAGCAQMGHKVDISTCALKKLPETSGAFAPSLTLALLAGAFRLLRSV